MAVIYGWVQNQPGTTLRDWSTFTTKFPGPGNGWVKVFQIESCCPSVYPPIEECSVFLLRGPNIYVLRDFDDLQLMATGPKPYTDIAVLGNKLYARNFSGQLDEYTIGTNTLTLTTPIITTIGNGTSLASDGTYLIYDISSGPNAGKIARTDPGTWTETLFDIPFSVTAQGDILLVGDDKLMITTFENISSLLIIDNDPVTPTVQYNEQIVDGSSNIITNIYSAFQEAGVIYIVRSDGSYYSMSESYPITFSFVDVLNISGTEFSDWNGAAQEGECGTVVPPYEPDMVTFDLKFKDMGSGSGNIILEDCTVTTGTGDILTDDTLDLSIPPFEKTYDDPATAPNFHVEFTLGLLSANSLVTTTKIVDGITTIVDTLPIAPGDPYSKTFTDTPTTSFVLDISFLVT